MIKELSKCIREYKAASIKAPIYVSLEVVMECIIPFIIAQLVNEIKAGCSFSVIATYGSILLVMAAVSLVFGVMAGTAAATGSCGFAKNLRKDMFYKIQTYSFKNIDRFSTSLSDETYDRRDECADGVYDDYPNCNSMSADVDFFLYNGIYYGRKDGMDLCDSCSGTWCGTGADHPSDDAAVSESL